MYTIDNNVNSLQDIVTHVHNIYHTDVMIWNAYCAIIAGYNMEEEFEIARCFNDDKIYQNCQKVLVKIITTSLEKGYYSDLCWSGIRKTVQKCVINDNDFFLMLDKYLSTTDKLSNPKINEAMVRNIGCNDIEFEHIRDIYDSLPILTDNTVMEIFSLMTKCLKEFSERGILREYIVASD